MLLEEKSKAMIENKPAIIPVLAPLCFTSCTLNCKHCILMIPRLDKFSIDFSKIKEWSDKILEQVDEVIRYSPGSGEVLLYKDLEKLLEYALNHKKIYNVSVFTNATVIPRETLIPFMQHPKFCLFITDYGILKQQAELLEFCERNKIRTNPPRDNKWFPVDYHPHNRTKADLIKIFSRCQTGKNCKTIYNSRLYHCGQMAAFVATGIAEPNNSNSLDIMGGDMRKDKYIRFTTMEYSETCDLCSLWGDETIPSAEQESGKLHKSSYAIKSRQELADQQAYIEALIESKGWLETQYHNYKKLYEDYSKNHDEVHDNDSNEKGFKKWLKNLR